MHQHTFHIQPHAWLHNHPTHLHSWYVFHIHTRQSTTFDVPSFSVPWFMVTACWLCWVMLCSVLKATCTPWSPQYTHYASLCVHATHSRANANAQNEDTTFANGAHQLAFQVPHKQPLLSTAWLSLILREHCRICSQACHTVTHCSASKRRSVWSWYQHFSVTRPWWRWSYTYTCSSWPCTSPSSRRSYSWTKCQGWPQSAKPTCSCSPSQSHHSSSLSSHSEQHSRPGTPPSPPPPTDSSSDEDKEFNDVFNSLSTPRRLSPPTSPTRAAREERAQWTPQFGRRSQVAAVARDGPAGNKTRHKALDVWRFFTAIHTHNYCVFCEWVATIYTIGPCLLIWKGRHTVQIPKNRVQSSLLIPPLVHCEHTCSNFILMNGSRNVTNVTSRLQPQKWNHQLTLIGDGKVRCTAAQVQTHALRRNIRTRLLLMCWLSSSLRMTK